MDVYACYLLYVHGSVPFVTQRDLSSYRVATHKTTIIDRCINLNT